MTPEELKATIDFDLCKSVTQAMGYDFDGERIRRIVKTNLYDDLLLYGDPLAKEEIVSISEKKK